MRDIELVNHMSKNNHLPQVNCTNEKVSSDVTRQTNINDENQQQQKIYERSDIKVSQNCKQWTSLCV